MGTYKMITKQIQIKSKNGKYVNTSLSMGFCMSSHIIQIDYLLLIGLHKHLDHRTSLVIILRNDGFVRFILCMGLFKKVAHRPEVVYAGHHRGQRHYYYTEGAV